MRLAIVIEFCGLLKKNIMKERIIRAAFDENTITIYQAYNRVIAENAVRNQTFVAPFKVDRMTWIKPSFLWMMYRSGWSTKQGQEHVLSIKIEREGWEWALENSCLSHFNEDEFENRNAWKKTLSESPVRIQWDPEKDIFLNKLDFRSIQVGLSGIAVEKYLNDWIVNIEDISSLCHEIKGLIDMEEIESAKKRLPIEREYPIRKDLMTHLRVSE